MAAIKHLVEYQANKHLLLAPKLTAGSISPSHFDKMKVGQALNFFSKSVSAGIRFMVAEAQNMESELYYLKTSGLDKQYLTTAWFIE